MAKIKNKLKINKITITMIILDVLVAICFIVVYFIPVVKNTIITTAMITKTHQYIAYTFYSEKTINETMAADTFTPLMDNVNLDDIVINTKEKKKYDNKYDEEILTREAGNNDYKLIKLKAGKYDAFLVAIYDPSKVKLIHSKKFNTGSGQERVIDMCKRYNGLVCINGGAFSDTGLGSDIPMGYLIADSKVIWQDPTKKNGDKALLIGFTKQNKLLLLNSTPEEAINKGMRDALEFGPFLIINGKKITYGTSTGGSYSRAARVVIGQRKDGVVLFLVTNGTHGFGPTMTDVIDVMEMYGAYNAANLDGGTSTTLVVKNKLINTPKNIYGEVIANGRKIVSGFGLMK